MELPLMILWKSCGSPKLERFEDSIYPGYHGRAG